MRAEIQLMRQESNELGLKEAPESISQLHVGLTAIRDAVEEKADAKQVEELHDDDIVIERSLLGLQKNNRDLEKRIEELECDVNGLLHDPLEHEKQIVALKRNQRLPIADYEDRANAEAEAATAAGNRRPGQQQHGKRQRRGRGPRHRRRRGPAAGRRRDARS